MEELQNETDFDGDNLRKKYFNEEIENYIPDDNDIFVFVKSGDF